ncbi:MAG: septum formation protein Maf [Candidatus Pelagibacter sp. TMED196]|nr:MAG: septum formation protein Maf [Candidatus Pelagibacter sp. TMED196]|tara:strand:- start:2901 stop:3482 length:582 start_codon:yes stop_codon:yes gene_type:complete
MKIILASKSGVRKKILDANNIENEVIGSNVNEEEVKVSLIAEGATPMLISKNLAELKANKVSSNNPDQIVLGADSVIDCGGKLISKPKTREEALSILKKLSGKNHSLISSVCISKNAAMIWNYTDTSSLTMKELDDIQLKSYLNKIKDEDLFAYGVYQIEADGKSLFSKIEGDENSIMGLPVKKIIEYLKSLK